MTGKCIIELTVKSIIKMTSKFVIDNFICQWYDDFDKESCHQRLDKTSKAGRHLLRLLRPETLWDGRERRAGCRYIID